ncbi:hypothetical protein ACFSTC_00795 [Nonomuraea ferruginea]
MNHGHDETVAFETVAPQPVISVRRTVPVAELPRTQAEILAALWAHLGEHGVRPAGPPYVRYHAFGDVETDVEVGVPVQGVAASRGEVAMGELPGGPSRHHLASRRARPAGRRLRPAAGVDADRTVQAGGRRVGDLHLDRPRSPP